MNYPPIFRLADAFIKILAQWYFSSLIAYDNGVCRVSSNYEDNSNLILRRALTIPISSFSTAICIKFDPLSDKSTS